MSGENNRTRRSVIKKASLTGLISVPLVSSSAAAQSTEDEYVINENGFLEYHGPKDSGIESAVKGMNKAKREGKIEFVVKNGEVVTKSTTAHIAGCAGENEYENHYKLSGLVHELELDHCATQDLVDALLAGAGAAAVAALISGYLGNAPVAIVSKIAAAILGVGWKVVDNNDEGKGVVIKAPAPATVLAPMDLGVDPQ